MGQLISFPHFGIYDKVFAELLERLDLDVLPPTPTSKKTVELGVKHSPELICLPFKYTLGDYIDALNKGANTLINFSSCGICRMRHYHTLHEQILKELGYEFEMHTIRADKHLLFDFKRISKKISTVRALQSLWLFWKKVKEAEAKDERQNGTEPRIGLVGEIYTLLNERVNLDLINKLKKMDVNVHQSLKLSDYIKHGLHLDFKKREEKKEAKKMLPEPIGGHAFQTIYNTIWYGKNNFDGVIFCMPFPCAPEATIEGLVQGIAQRYSLPLLILKFDENISEVNVDNRLNAFVEMIKRKK